MDDLNLDLDTVQSNEEQKLQVKDRFAKLTEKGLEADKARLDAEARAKEASERAEKAEKDANFYKSFSQISAKHPGASEYQDQILEKVNKGYDPEDAALAVLAKEGKLGNQPTQPQATPNVAGGSSLTNLGDGGAKSVSEMSQVEKAEALMQMEREGANLLKF